MYYDLIKLEKDAQTLGEVFNYSFAHFNGSEKNIYVNYENYKISILSPNTQERIKIYRNMNICGYKYRECVPLGNQMLVRDLLSKYEMDGEPPIIYDTLAKIINQLEKCNYECEGGNLENNVAFIALKKMAD